MNEDGAFHIRVRLSEAFREGVGEFLSITTPVKSLGEVIGQLEEKVPRFSEAYDDGYVFAVNGQLVLWAVSATVVQNGDEIEIMLALAGG